MLAYKWNWQPSEGERERKSARERKREWEGEKKERKRMRTQTIELNVTTFSDTPIIKIRTNNNNNNLSTEKWIKAADQSQFRITQVLSRANAIKQFLYQLQITEWYLFFVWWTPNKYLTSEHTHSCIPHIPAKEFYSHRVNHTRRPKRIDKFNFLIFVFGWMPLTLLPSSSKSKFLVCVVFSLVLFTLIIIIIKS